MPAFLFFLTIGLLLGALALALWPIASEAEADRLEALDDANNAAFDAECIDYRPAVRASMGGA